MRDESTKLQGQSRGKVKALATKILEMLEYDDNTKIVATAHSTASLIRIAQTTMAHINEANQKVAPAIYDEFCRLATKGCHYF